jgi:Flp pilus assembly protein TadD
MGAGWIRLGWALVADRRYVEAVPVFEQATRLRPRSARSWRGLGIAYAHTGRDAAAIQAFRLSLRIDPDQPDVHSDLQASYRALAGVGQSAEAVAES